MNAPRYPANEKAFVEVYGREGTVSASVKNISRSGACLEWIQADFKVEPGALLRMTVSLPQLNQTHDLNAIVVWSDGNVSGLNFLRPDQVFERLAKKG